MHSQWEFCHCCLEHQDLPHKRLTVQPEILAQPLQLHAKECFPFPAQDNDQHNKSQNMSQKLTEKKKKHMQKHGNDTLKHRRSYRMKEICLSSQCQQPQTSLQITGAYAWVKLLGEKKKKTNLTVTLKSTTIELCSKTCFLFFPRGSLYPTISPHLA